LEGPIRTIAQSVPILLKGASPVSTHDPKPG
jgi:hypothetical protein